MEQFVAGDTPERAQPAPPKKPDASAEDIAVFAKLVEAVDGHLVADQPLGTGVVNLDTVRAMFRSGVSLEADILPVLRSHARARAASARLLV